MKEVGNVVFRNGVWLMIFTYLISCNQQKSQSYTVSSSSVLCSPNSIATTSSIDGLGEPKLRMGLGNSILHITTKQEKAQEWFNYGLNLIHSFWHIEAYRVFKQVIKIDSGCAMGYWGIAMCQPGFGGDDSSIWRNAIQKAKELSSDCSPLEKDLIQASEILLTKGINGEAVQSFQSLATKYPNNAEILSFLAIVLRQNVRSDDNWQSSDKVKHFLEDALKNYPNHIGLQHYYVHVMEVRPDFIKVKGIVEKMYEDGKNAPHIAHMPGHIYFLEGNYKKAIEVFEEARKEEIAYHREENIQQVADQNYMHNLQYLAVSYCEIDDYENAISTAKQFSYITLKQSDPKNAPTQLLLYKGRIMEALVNIRFRKYKKATENLSFWLNNIDFPIQNEMVKLYLNAMNAYCKGMLAIEKGDRQMAEVKGMELTKFMRDFEQTGVTFRGKKEFTLINETYDILSMARYELAGWIDNMDTKKPFNEAAWNEALNLEKAIPYQEPPRLMYPISESLSRLHHYRNEPLKARSAQKEALKIRPNSKQILAIF